MAIKKHGESVKNGDDGQEGANDPGPAPLANAAALPPASGTKEAKDQDKAVQDYREVTGDPSGAAKNSQDAGVLASAEAINPGSVVESPAVREAKNKAAEEERARVAKEQGAEYVKPKPPRKARLKAMKYPLTDPKTRVRVPLEGTPEKVEISTWMQAQINVGLVVELED
jgi:hypothetical protein